MTSNPLALVDTKNLPGLDVIRNLNPFHQAQKDFCKSRSYEENIDRVFDICQEFEETSFGTAFRKRLKAFSCISEINDDIKSSRYDRVTEDIPKSSNNKRLSIQKTNTQIRIDPFDTEIVEFQFQSKNSESTTTNTCMCSEVRSVGNLASRPDSASNSAPPSTKSEDKDINYRFENMIINEGDQILRADVMINRSWYEYLRNQKSGPKNFLEIPSGKPTVRYDASIFGHFFCTRTTIRVQSPKWSKNAKSQGTSPFETPNRCYLLFNACFYLQNTKKISNKQLHICLIRTSSG